ncbi:NAD(P)-binding protein [Aulographum hederae CBS 113979]|uniref:NAD(P)-binding protein n=1 Tax=Aulographum hederae CBS 113979 TaxID=1176131 RepID=A0A6G1GR46_9PEZI|nr:NAD(P)-binding protein [Aulographum hederae CBS 113979]
MSKAILITGATGQQGGATINALIESPEASDFTILAVTRNAESAGAKKLLEKSQNIKLVQGDLNEPEKLFEKAKEVANGEVWGVFSVQVPMGSGQTTGTEEAQGKALVDAAIANKVKYFVYTSVDRNGDRSLDNPTPIPHFISKHNIEHHLKDKTAGGEMEWTVLRPTAFMDNFVPGFQGKGFSTCWKVALKGKPLQLIAVSDIGRIAALCFLSPSTYKSQYISLAGADISWDEAAATFKQKFGGDMPLTFEFVGHAFLWAVAEMGTMMKWFYDEGYGADIKKVKEMHPGLLGWGEWLERESGFAKKE